MQCKAIIEYKEISSPCPNRADMQVRRQEPADGRLVLMLALCGSCYRTFFRDSK